MTTTHMATARRTLLIGGCVGALLLGVSVWLGRGQSASGHSDVTETASREPVKASRTSSGAVLSPAKPLVESFSDAAKTKQEASDRELAFLRKLKEGPESAPFDEAWAFAVLSDPKTPGSYKAALLERLREKGQSWKAVDAPRWERLLKVLIESGARDDVSFKAGRLVAKNFDTAAKQRLAEDFRARRLGLSEPVRLGYVAAIDDVPLLNEVLSDSGESAAVRRQASARFSAVAPRDVVVREFSRASHPREVRRELVRGIFHGESSENETRGALEAARKADVAIAANFALATSKQPKRLSLIRREWENSVAALEAAPTESKHFDVARAAGSSLALAYHRGAEIPAEEKSKFMQFVELTAGRVSRVAPVGLVNHARAALVIDWIQACRMRDPKGCQRLTQREHALSEKLLQEMHTKLAGGDIGFLLERVGWLP